MAERYANVDAVLVEDLERVVARRDEVLGGVVARLEAEGLARGGGDAVALVGRLAGEAAAACGCRALPLPPSPVAISELFGVPKVCWITLFI